jgi:hypothetical protein
MRELPPELRREDALSDGVGPLLFRVEDWLLVPGAGPEALAQRVGSRELELGSSICDLGSSEALDFEAIRQLGDFVRCSGATRVFEDLGFSTLEDRRSPLALPLPRCDEVVALVSARMRLVQRLLPVPLDLRWIEAPVSDPGELSELEFVRGVEEATGCRVLGLSAEELERENARLELLQAGAPRRGEGVAQRLAEVWQELSSAEEPRAAVWRERFFVETRRRLAPLLGEPALGSCDPEWLRRRITGMLHEMGPRGIDPREWAERFVAHCLLQEEDADLAPILAQWERALGV